MLKGQKLVNDFFCQKYIIAIYDEDEYCIGVCDNVREFARFIKRSNQNANFILARARRDGNKTKMIMEKRKYEIYLIDMFDEEEKGETNEKN